MSLDHILLLGTPTNLNTGDLKFLLWVFFTSKILFARSLQILQLFPVSLHTLLKFAKDWRLELTLKSHRKSIWINYLNGLKRILTILWCCSLKNCACLFHLSNILYIVYASANRDNASPQLFQLICMYYYIYAKMAQISSLLI